MNKILLDDPDKIKKIDLSDELKLIAAFPEQCRSAVNTGRSLKFNGSYSGCENIVYSGMGGSAIGADLVRSYLMHDACIPIYVNRDYVIPKFVSSRTLFIASSYSGDTEETLSAYGLAKKKNARIMVITSGGKLADMASKDEFACIRMPSGYPPRCAVGLSFFLSLFSLIKSGYADERAGDIDEAVGMLRALRDEKLSIGVKCSMNISKQIAMAVYEKYPVIYGASDRVDSVAIRWRGQFAENAKHLASSQLFPEMNHNEIVGWQNPSSLSDGFVAIFLRDAGEDKRVSKRISITRDILKKEGFDTMEVSSAGDSALSRMLSLIYIGDFASFYLAVLNGVDPTPVDKIVYIKRKLNR